MAERLKYLLKYQHLVIVPYHPQGNSMAECRMKEVGAHHRALVYEYLIKSEWSHYLPLVHRILNYTLDGSIGTQPGRVIFGDMVDCDLAMHLQEGTTGRNPEDYLLKLREAQSILVQVTQDYLKKHQRKRSVDGGPKNLEVTKFAVGDYVLLTYPNRPPNKLAGMYRGPVVITVMDRQDLVKVRDLITNKESMVHANRLRPFKHQQKLLAIQARARIPRNGNFVCVGLDTSRKTISCWTGQRSRTWKGWMSSVRRILISIWDELMYLGVKSGRSS